MLHHKTQLNDYTLYFENITVNKASAIDYEARLVEFNSLSECKAVFNNLRIVLKQNNQTIFDTEQNSYENLDFDIALKIYKNIKKELCLSDDEIQEFSDTLLRYFADKQHEKMPLELIIAQNIINKTTALSLAELENMNIKKYEKIQIAIKKILDKTKED